MYWVDRIDWTRDGSAIFYVGVQLLKTMRESASKEYELMQFTGLLDRNKKDIYEGDIVNGLPVEYHNYYFALKKESKTGTVWYGLNYEHELEVIGNIWENRQLLFIS